MAEQNGSHEALITKTKDAFQRADYSSAYRYSAELMRAKTASVVVYMHCVSSLKLRVASKERVDSQINDTLLLATALDNFYKQSGMKNENIRTYVSEILFTLMTATIESIQKHYPLKNGRRSVKHAAESAQETLTNLKVLTSYDLSEFSVELPEKMNAFLNETGNKLSTYMNKWVSVVRDATNNWLFEDDTNDLFERIVAYQIQVNAAFAKEDDSAHYSDQEIKSFISDITEKSKPKKLDPESENEIAAAPGEQPETNEPVAETQFKAPDHSEPTQTRTSSRLNRDDTESRKGLKPIDIVIGVLVVLFVIVVSIIIVYAIKPSLITSLFGG